jgi:hypothetical protein
MNEIHDLALILAVWGGGRLTLLVLLLGFFFKHSLLAKV